MDSLNDALSAILDFREERDWAKFHTVKNLAAALAIEASELQEILLWKRDSEVNALLSTDDGRGKIEEELADVLIFTLLLCHEAKVDPLKAIRRKLRINAEKYPVALARGRADKYTTLHSDLGE